MFTPDQYELIDFGAGRKLERFGEILLDRPAPAAESFKPSDPAAWAAATARFERTDVQRGAWQPSAAAAATWTIRHDASVFELKLTEFGHLGVFAEQAAQWDWIATQIKAAPQPCRVLNLFAYTGGSTLAAAVAGAEVTHVDAAQNTVGWARRNAELSGLQDAPIRWIAEDAVKFVRRELKRGRAYDAVVLDPPSFGRGPAGETWKLEHDLPELLRLCAELTAERPRFLLITCHSTGVTAADAQAWLNAAITSSPRGSVSAGEMTLTARDGRQLPSGVYARWTTH